MDISYDGVSLTKSCGRSIEVLSGKFWSCRQVYPLAIGVAEKNFSDTMRAEEVTKSTLTNLRKEGVHVRNMIMDAPKRSGKIKIGNFIIGQRKLNFLFPFFVEIRNQKGHNSYYSCDICFRKATYYEPQANPQDRRRKAKGATMVYPANGEEADRRSHERHLQLARRSNMSPEDEEADFYGVNEGKLFLAKVLPHLDLVFDICIDWMHLVLEGKNDGIDGH